MRVTVARPSALVAEKGIKLFAIVDHSGEADAVGLHLREAKVVMVGFRPELWRDALGAGAPRGLTGSLRITDLADVVLRCIRVGECICEA